MTKQERDYLVEIFGDISRALTTIRRLSYDMSVAYPLLKQETMFTDMDENVFNARRNANGLAEYIGIATAVEDWTQAP